MPFTNYLYCLIPVVLWLFVVLRLVLLSKGQINNLTSPHTNHLNLYTKNKGRPILILDLNFFSFFFLSYSPLLIVNLQRFGFHALTSVSLDQMILIFYTMFFLCITHRSRSILAHYAFLWFSSYDLAFFNWKLGHMCSMDTFFHLFIVNLI